MLKLSTSLSLLFKSTMFSTCRYIYYIYYVRICSVCVCVCVCVVHIDTAFIYSVELSTSLSLLFKSTMLSMCTTLQVSQAMPVSCLFTMRACIYIYVCMYVCMIFVCMYVCMYIYICLCLFTMCMQRQHDREDEHTYAHKDTYMYALPQFIRCKSYKCAGCGNAAAW